MNITKYKQTHRLEKKLVATSGKDEGRGKVWLGFKSYKLLCVK